MVVIGNFESTSFTSIFASNIRVSCSYPKYSTITRLLLVSTRLCRNSSKFLPLQLSSTITGSLQPITRIKQQSFSS
jgi:hypothetical protein